MPEKIINGRLHEAREDGIYRRVPLGMDETKSMKQDPPPEYVVRDGKPFEIIENTDEYVARLQAGGTKPCMAEKSGYVIPRRLVPGEEIPVYSQNGVLEANETAGKDCILLTKAGPDGHPVVDGFGHMNQWQTTETTFREKYDVPAGEITSDRPVKPKGVPQKFIQADRDVALMVPWGKNGSLIPQVIEKGGYLNITDPSAVYGISARDFTDTYQVKNPSRRDTKDLDAAAASIEDAGNDLEAEF